MPGPCGAGVDATGGVCDVAARVAFAAASVPGPCGAWVVATGGA